MNSNQLRRFNIPYCTCLLMVALAFLVNTALAQTQPRSSTLGFESPALAVAALTEAANNYDVAQLKAVLGPDSDDLIESGDAVQDKNKALEFAKSAKQKSVIELSKDKKHATLSTGENGWPFPVPLVKRGQKWYFDSKSGRAELLRRRIGANELDAITICRGFVEAQKEYALDLHDGASLNQYAQRIISSPGKHDGLYWKNPDGSDGGPISESIAKAIQEGYSTEKQVPAPYHGYIFKILKGRGPSAPEGEVSFLVGDMMIGGFALAATPAEYGVSGIKSFIVSHEGIVYQKDLGPDSFDIFSRMEKYNPDKTWARTDDNWPDQTDAD